MVPSGVDKERIQLQLSRLSDLSAYLDNARARLNESPEDLLVLAGAERLLQTLAEECINIGQHIIAGLNLGRPDTYKDVFLRLHEGGVIDQELSDRMMELAAFRNRLVHLYWQINRDEIMVWLQERRLARELAEQAYEYLNKRNLL